MWNEIFLDNGTWVNYSIPHFVSFIFFALLGLILVRQARYRWSYDQKHKYWFYFCLFLFACQYSKVIIRWQLGVFDYKVDIPLELCNMLPIFMAIAVYFKSRKWWAILFFWIISGTFQANLTPTLLESFPHYEYFRYWIVHMGLTFAALYGVFVFGYRVTLKDAFRAFIWLNIVAWTMFVVNHFIGANYMYMQGKPPGKTIYNLLGEWPVYLLQLQFLMWLLYFIVLTPFWILKRIESKN